MKILIGILLLKLFTLHSDYYVTNAQAFDSLQGTFYLCENDQIFADYDHYSGKVTLVMNSKGTEDFTDDEIFAVIER